MKEFVKLRTGGEEYSLTVAERVIFLLLKEKSPHTVSYKELKEKTKYTSKSIKRAMYLLRPLITMEGGVIEPVYGLGYRLLSIGKFE